MQAILPWAYRPCFIQDIVLIGGCHLRAAQPNVVILCPRREGEEEGEEKEEEGLCCCFHIGSVLLVIQWEIYARRRRVAPCRGTQRAVVLGLYVRVSGGMDYRGILFYIHHIEEHQSSVLIFFFLGQFLKTILTVKLYG